jgi:hypothetical protein
MKTFQQFIIERDIQHTNSNYDIERKDMPQIAATDHPEFIKHMADRGIQSQKKEIPAGNLKPTQSKFDQDKVDAMSLDTAKSRTILVSGCNHIIDGHHTWKKLHQSGSKVKVIQLKAPIEHCIQHAKSFPKSFVRK